MEVDRSRDAQSPSEAILHGVAEREGVPPEQLNPPLYDVVDPDALERIFRGETGQLSFEFHGYVVTVDHSGYVTLESTDAD